MSEKLLPVDVIKAGCFDYPHNINLRGFKPRNDNKHQLYKLVTLKNGAIVTLNYNTDFQYFSVRASVPKVLYGCNTCNLYQKDADQYIHIVNDILSAEHIHLNFENFKISVLEVSFNYICKSVKDKQNYIEFFSKQAVNRKTKKVYKTSVVYKNKQSRLTIYDKAEEILAKSRTAAITKDADKILRVEYTLNRKALKKHHKDLTVGAFLREFDLEKILIKENIKSGLSEKALKKKDFYTILRRKIKSKRKNTQNRILKFYKLLNQYGEEYVQENYTRYQISAYKRIMLDLGYSPFYLNNSTAQIDFMKLRDIAPIEKIRKEMKYILAKLDFKKIKKNRRFKFNVRDKLSQFSRCTFFQSIFNFFDTS